MKKLLNKIPAVEYRETLKYLIFCFILFLIMNFLLGIAYIPSASMEPTLTVGKQYPFFPMSYVFKEPERGDIIVFDDHGVVYCKRIIGLPGEVVDLIAGEVYIDGELLTEEYAYGQTYPYYEYHYEVPEGEYFFMGDNRENSRDSRLWDYPYIKKSQILGKLYKFAIKK